MITRCTAALGGCQPSAATWKREQFTAISKAAGGHPAYAGMIYTAVLRRASSPITATPASSKIPAAGSGVVMIVNCVLF